MVIDLYVSGDRKSYGWHSEPDFHTKAGNNSPFPQVQEAPRMTKYREWNSRRHDFIESDNEFDDETIQEKLDIFSKELKEILDEK